MDMSSKNLRELRPANVRKTNERKKHMKTITKLIYSTFAVVGLAVSTLPTNADPGDIFVGDYGNGTIYKFTADGARSTFATGLAGPVGLAFDAAGNLFEADDGSGTIYKFAPDGTQSTFAIGLTSPRGLAFDNAGNLLEADYGTGTIYKFAPDGTRSTFATGLNGPYGLAFDNLGNLFVADYNGNTIYKFAPDGTRTTFVDMGLNHPAGLAFDSSGYLFEADSSNATHTIYKFAPDGTRTTFASAGLNSPIALVFDNAGNLFAADGLIYKFAPDGTRSTFASGLNFPAALAIQPTEPTPTPTPPPHQYAAQVLPPINTDNSSIFTVRRGVVPVKFSLSDNGSPTCDLPPATIAATRTGGGVIGQVNESTYSGNADSGSNFRIDGCQYIYNLNSRALGVGTYRVDILIDGQVVGSATFELR
jgi:sugar lactone lactonase YvrE